MNRQEMLAAAAAAHQAWLLEHADQAPAVPADSDPHDGVTSDYAEHHADRSASAEVDDLLGQQLADLLAAFAGIDGPDVQAAAGDPVAQRLQEQWERKKAQLLRRWPKLAGKMVEELADQAEAAIEAGDLALLGDLQVSAGVVAAVAVPIRKAGTELAAEAAAGVVEEAAAQDTSIAAPDEPGAERVRQHADLVARIIANGYASGAARLGLQLSGSSPAEVKAEVARHLDQFGATENGFVADHIGGLLSAAQHAGRLAVLEENPAREYEASEKNDDRNRCDNCREANGRRYGTLAAALKDYPVSGLKACSGGTRCRGHLLPHW